MKILLTSKELNKESLNDIQDKKSSLEIFFPWHPRGIKLPLKIYSWILLSGVHSLIALQPTASSIKTYGDPSIFQDVEIPWNTRKRSWNTEWTVIKFISQKMDAKAEFECLGPGGGVSRGGLKYIKRRGEDSRSAGEKKLDLWKRNWFRSILFRPRRKRDT